MDTLTAGRVKTIKLPGRYSAGVPGLYLVVTPSGTKNWVQRIVIDGKRRDRGLGSVKIVSLKQARVKALENRDAVAEGRNPWVTAPLMPTFRECADMTIAMNEPRWRHPKTVLQFRRALETYAYPVLGDVRIDRLDRGQVLAVLTPIWITKPTVAKKLRQRLRQIVALALAHGWIETNPAGEMIDAALPRQRVGSHFRGLDYRKAPAALAAVDASSAPTTARLCFRFMVLTAARSGEARGATWDEVDMNARTWTIPAARMKGGVEHRVPLSDAAYSVITDARALDNGSGYVFPSARAGEAMTGETLAQVLRVTGLVELTTLHGLRTTFRTWTLEQTDSPWAVSEAALAHALGNSTEQAYARSDLFDRRRELMQAWADYICGSRSCHIPIRQGGPAGAVVARKRLKVIG